MATRVMRNKSLSRLAMTTALTSMAMFGYGRGAYAGVCDPVGGVGYSTYLCQGAVQPGDTGQSLSGSPLAVTTSDTFAIDVSGSAVTLNGEGGITFDTPDDWVGYITGSGYGIEANNNEGGNILITTTGGAVTGTNGAGIRLDNGDDEGLESTITVTTGNVIGVQEAIQVENNSSGFLGSNVTINTVAGAVLSSGDKGIQVENYGESETGTSNISITTGNVTGDEEGIEVLNLGYAFGDTNVIVNTVAGVVTGGTDHDGILVRTGYYGDGYVYSAASVTGSANVEITTGTVTGGDDGIGVQHYATALDNSNITITTTAGAVTGTAADGIEVTSFATAQQIGNTNITVTTGNVTGANDGIDIAQFGEAAGSSNIFVDTRGGVVVGTNGTGIEIDNYGQAGQGTTDVTVFTGIVTGGDYGIRVYSDGDGPAGSNVAITSTGAVFATEYDGIRALQQGFSEEGSANLTITTADVTSPGGNGITALVGRPIQEIESPGMLQQPEVPINLDYNGPIIILPSSGGLTGNTIVIDTTGGTVTAGDEEAYGILAASYGFSRDGTSITIDTAAVTGGDVGVQAVNFGVSTMGNTDVTIDTTEGDVSGGNQGIVAGNLAYSQDGTANLSVTTGNVTGTLEDGIFAGNGAQAEYDADIVITTTDGTVSSTDGYGIYALQAATSDLGTTDLEITTGDVTTVNGTAIFAQIGSTEFEIEEGEDPVPFEQSAYDGSSLTIDTTDGTVSSLNGAGIVAVNDGSAFYDTDITVRTGNVLLGSFEVYDNASVAISVTNTGTSEAGSATTSVTTGDSDIRSYYGTAISVYSEAQANYDTDITIDASGGSVISTYDTGIFASNQSYTSNGTSDITITTTGGEVIGGSGTGIVARNGTETGGIVINAGDTTGAYDGIFTDVDGSGGLSVTSFGYAIGASGAGIAASNDGGGATSITVGSDGAARGSTAGIDVYHSSEAAFTITNSGTVANTSGNTDDLAINASSADGASGVTLTNASGADLYGTVDLTDEADIFDNFGFWDTSGGTSDFGDGNDVLNNGSPLTLVVGNGAANQMTVFTDLETFNNSGRIDFLDGFASDRLSTDGDFNGLLGSFIEMDFVAGGDGAAADVFEIGGNVSGTTEIFVDDAAGSGALTGMEQNDGIELVRVTGTTDAGDFVLDGPEQVNVYLYDELVLGTDNVWRLQSQYLPVIPDYEVYPQALLALSDVGTYRERRGARAVAMGNAAGTSEVWMQIEGRQIERGAAGSTSETSYEQDIAGVTVGVDSQLQGGLIAGVNLGFSEATTSMSSVHGGGVIDTTGWSLGATLTWHGASGLYVDGVAQVAWFDSDMAGVTGNSGESYALSLEVGQEVALQDGWSVVPQAQLSYTSVGFDSFTGSDFGETVRLGAGDSLLARLGVSIDRAWAGAGGTENRVYGMLNLTRELADGTSVSVGAQGFDALDFDRDPDGTRVELGLGGSFGLGNGSYLYGDVTASQGVDASGDAEMSGRLGFNFTW